MAAMVLLAFAILMFSAMIIQSSRLMERGRKNMTYYEEGQNALNARDTENGYIAATDAKLYINAAAGENDFAGLTPSLRKGEGNRISVRLYRQQLDWSKAVSNKNTAAESETEAGNVLFTYDLAAYAAVETDENEN